MIMAGTFSQLYVQVVFAVKGRENLIRKEFRAESCQKFLNPEGVTQQAKMHHI
jgi:hypothetical protein